MKNIATDTFFLEDIFEEGWRAFRVLFVKCVPIVLAFGFLKGLLVAAVTDWIPAKEMAARLVRMVPADSAVNEAELADRILIKLSGLVDNFFTYLVFSVALLAVVKAAERAVTQRPFSTGEILAEAIRRWPRYLWTSFLAGFVILLLCFLFIVPGLIWSVYYLFVPYVVAVTSLSGGKALDYSKGLVKGAFWRTFGYFFVINFTAAIPALMLTLCLSTAENLAKGGLSAIPAVWLAFRAILNAIPLLVIPFQLSLGTVFFLNAAYLRRQAAGDRPHREEGTGKRE